MFSYRDCLNIEYLGIISDPKKECGNMIWKKCQNDFVLDFDNKSSSSTSTIPSGFQLIFFALDADQFMTKFGPKS